MRVAVIGAGSMGRHHARVYSELPDVELVAVADQDPQRAIQIAQSYDAKPYTNYKEMLDRELLDAVSVVVPITGHKDVSFDAISRGLHALIEKPIAADLREAEDIVDLAYKTGSKLIVGHIERFNPALIEMKTQLNAGRIDPIYRIQTNRQGPFARRIRDVGVAMDLATHDLDIMLHLSGSKVERVSAEILAGIRTEQEDLVTGLLRFENGVVGALDVNWLSPVKQRYLEVIGEGGMFRLDFQTQDLDFFSSDANLEASNGLLREHNGDGQTKQSVTVVPYEPLRKELEVFVEVVANGYKPPVGGEEALEVVRLATMLVDAARQGETIRFVEGVGSL